MFNFSWSTFIIAENYARVNGFELLITLVSNDIGYDGLQATFEDNVPRDASLFQEYHALIVRHGKSVCRKKPLCATCPLSSICEFAPSQADVS